MSETTVTLMLSDEERAVLFDILEERHRALLREIWHTDSRDFKLFLQKKERVLESLLNRFMARLAPLDSQGSRSTSEIVPLGDCLSLSITQVAS